MTQDEATQMMDPPARVPKHVYRDPLDLVWAVTAKRLGLTLHRTSETYASTDGEFNLFIGTPETLDPDDSLAQLIFHELCHWIANGVDSVNEIDWGFGPMVQIEPGELVALRLQAHLAGEWGLLKLLASTTDARTYWDEICGAPLVPLDESDLERTVTAEAIQAVALSQQPPFGEPLKAALSASAEIAKAVEQFSGEDPAGLW